MRWITVLWVHTTGDFVRVIRYNVKHGLSRLCVCVCACWKRRRFKSVKPSIEFNFFFSLIFNFNFRFSFVCKLFFDTLNWLRHNVWSVTLNRIPLRLAIRSLWDTGPVDSRYAMNFVQCRWEIKKNETVVSSTLVCSAWAKKEREENSVNFRLQFISFHYYLLSTLNQSICVFCCCCCIRWRIHIRNYPFAPKRFRWWMRGSSYYSQTHIAIAWRKWNGERKSVEDNWIEK